jgi:uncharacterized damage-inducible protein DinB
MLDETEKDFLMNADHFRKMFDYNSWANRKMWDCARKLSDEQFIQAIDFSVGPIYVQIAHIISAEQYLVIERCAGKTETLYLQKEQITDRAELRSHWDMVDAEIRDYLGGITSDELERDITYSARENTEPRTDKLWEFLLQAYDHSLDHRAQIMTLLHIKFNATTVEQDYFHYLWQQTPTSEV